MANQFGSLEDIYEYKSRIYANPETIRQLGEYLSKVGGKLTGSIEIVDANDKQIAIIDSNGFRLTGGSIEVLNASSALVAKTSSNGHQLFDPATGKLIANLSSNGLKLTGGSIEVLNASSQQVALLDDAGLKITSVAQGSSLNLQPTAVPVEFRPPSPFGPSGNVITTVGSMVMLNNNTVGSSAVKLRSPAVDSGERSEIEARSAGANNASQAEIRVSAVSGGSFRFISSGDLHVSGNVTSKLAVVNSNFKQHLRLERPGVNNIEFAPTTNAGGVCDIYFNDVLVGMIGPNGFAHTDGQPIPRVRAGKTIMNFSARNTALATIDYGFTFPSPPSVTATLSGGGTKEFALRMGTVGTSSVALRATTDDSTAITGDFEVNWIAIAVT